MTNNTQPDKTPPDLFKTDSSVTLARPRSFFRYRRGDAWLYLTSGASIAFAVIFIVFAIWPRYKDPITRLYSSRLGYPTVARELQSPFPVKTATVEMRKLTSSYQGEGTVSSEPILVPIVPVGRVTRVHANVGDSVKKGQLLAEIDDRMQVLKSRRRRPLLSPPSTNSSGWFRARLTRCRTSAPTAKESA